MGARRKAAKVEQGSDARYLVIDGRRWRRADPGIPPKLRVELVDELMDARRAVGAAKRAQDPVAEKAARARVQSAKLALGERGQPYWEATDAARRTRAVATIRTLLARRQRRAAKSGNAPTICPSDVARVIAGERWRSSMQLVRDVAAQLVEGGALRVLQRGREVSIREARGPIRLAVS